jgi:hypothetical protein
MNNDKFGRYNHNPQLEEQNTELKTMNKQSKAASDENKVLMTKLEVLMTKLNDVISVIGTRNELNHGITHDQLNDVSTSIQCETENKGKD